VQNSLLIIHFGGIALPAETFLPVCSSQLFLGKAKGEKTSGQHAVRGMDTDEQAHHCDVPNTFIVNTEAVDLAGIKGKKMFLPGEVSITTGWYNREVSRSRSTQSNEV